MATCFTISLMFLLMTADVDGQQDWDVNYNPSYVCALRGSTVRMSCTYPYSWIKSVYWTKTVAVSPNLCSDSNYRENVQCHSYYSKTYNITLTHVIEADKGVYYCRFINGYGGEWSGTPGVQLDVTDLQVETQQRVKEGDSVTLTCKTTCSLTEETTFIWYRNGQKLTEGRLNSVRRHDSGLYRCALRGYEQLSSAGVYLSVEYVDGQQDWGVNYNPSYVCALRGSTVRMSCTLKYPPDHVVNKTFWTKTVVPDAASPDLCLNPEDRRVRCHGENKDPHSMTLTNVTEADKHIYYCRSTTIGSDEVWTGVPGVQLDVTDLQVETQQRVKEGDSVTLTCKTTCSLTEETTFIWYRNGQELPEHKVNEFHLQSVHRDNSGVYRCAAIRGHERLSSPDVYLNVKYADDLQYWGVIYNPSYICALRGSTVRMFCTLKYPSDHVVYNNIWTKAFYTAKDAADLCLKPTDKNRVCPRGIIDTHSITLTNVTEVEKNIYYCRFTTNKQEKWTGVPGVQLDVTDLQVGTQQRVKEGDSVTLTCKTTCSLTKEKTFIWYRNTQILPEHTVNKIHLQSVSRDDSGVYRCAAGRGSEHLSSPDFNLSVEYAPRNVSVSIRPSGVIVEGDSVTLTCRSESNPPVHAYSWFKEETSVGSGNVYIISNITSDHSGQYKCKTKNQHGEKFSEAVMLNVMYAPRNVTASISSSGVIVEGDSVNLTCSSESNPPVHIYSWFKENQTSSVGSGQTFSLSDISSRLSGWFYCIAQNKHGSQRSASVSLTVKGVQSSAVVSGIVAGCGGLFFVIIFIFIILFIRKKFKDGESDRNSQNQVNPFSGSAGAASANDVPLYSLVYGNQTEASESDDAGDVQYASVKYIRNKEITEKEQEECQYMNFKLNPTSDRDSSPVIYSSIK